MNNQYLVSMKRIAQKLSFFILYLFVSTLFFSCSSENGFKFAGSQRYALDSTESPIIFDEELILSYQGVARIGKCNIPLSKGIKSKNHKVVIFLSMDCDAKQIGENLKIVSEESIIAVADNKAFLKLDSIYDYMYFYDVETPSVTAVLHYFSKDSLATHDLYAQDYLISKIKP